MKLLSKFSVIIFLIAALPLSGKKHKHKNSAKVQPSIQKQELPKKGPSAITYTLSGGRLGDNLVAYLHAKWISYKYNIPLLYKEFPYSDQLMMHKLEKHYHESDYDSFFYHRTLQQGDPFDFQADSATLYIIPYFPECPQEHERLGYRMPYFAVDWNNQDFIQEIKKFIAPQDQLTSLLLPQDKITVAVHIRKRTPGFDGPVLFEQETPSLSWDNYADRWWPFKFATDEYYQEQIIRLSTFLGNPPLYVYLFTDAPNPVELVEQYKAAVQLPNIEFDCRKTINRHDMNVLEDFFALTHFDCLIRVESNFSITASKLANYTIQVSPTGYHYHPVKGYPVIDKVSFTVKNR